MKKTACLSAICIASFIAIVSGFYFGYKAGFLWNMEYESAEQERFDAYMEAQRMYGTIAAQEEAVNRFIEISNKRKSYNSIVESESVYAVDMAISYARLAFLAQERNSITESGQYLKQAESFCPAIGWKECSAEIISDFTHKLDENHAIKQKRVPR